MMQMILNGKSNEVIDISGYTRTLDIPDPNIRFRLDLNFNGEYSAAGIEYLAEYANKDITSIVISNDGNTVLETNSKATLAALNESCTGNDRYGYASINIYEANA